MRLTGADIVVRTLIEQGREVAFGYPGGQIINVYDSLYKYRDELRHVLTAHEQGAAHAADGYARATGRPGVVIATSGPGATNLVTGIATAFLDSVPLVAITGNVPSSQIGTDSFQEIDITGITLPITKHNYFVGEIEDLADTIREAFRLAVSGRPGPVLVDVPKDIQIAMYDYEPQPPAVPDPPHPAKEERVREAAECINAAHRPFIYFGGGLIASGAQEELLALEEKIDAPIGCSLMGVSGIPTDHPRFLGMQGMHGHYACSTAMHRSDCIIALGTRFNDRVTGDRTKFAKGAKLVQIDVDGSELSKNVAAVCGMRGDVKLTLQKLVELGVYEIVPVAMKRCVVKLDAKKAAAKTARWQGIAEAAAKQSRRAIVPRVRDVMSCQEALAYAAQMDVKLVPYELEETLDKAAGMEGTRQIIDHLMPGQSVSVFIGPEGGFDASEIQAAMDYGMKPVTLGRRILRTETAGMTVMAWMMYRLEC